MSRTNRFNLWNLHFTSDKAKCLSCKSKIILKNNSKTWHIIGDKDAGSGTIHNLIPICVGCNNNSKPFSSIYTYMADIGTMDYENAIYLEKNQRDYLAKCIQGTVDFKCLGYFKNGERCTYNRVTRFCCKCHSTEESISIYDIEMEELIYNMEQYVNFFVVVYQQNVYQEF